LKDAFRSSSLIFKRDFYTRSFWCCSYVLGYRRDALQYHNVFYRL